MGYFSVRVTGGEDCRVMGSRMKSELGGVDPDYTGSPNFFYVQRNSTVERLQRNYSSMARGYEVEVEEITEEQFYWRRR